jgi:hypothetical protein
MRFTTDCQHHLIIESPENLQSYIDIIRKADIQTSEKEEKKRVRKKVYFTPFKAGKLKVC